MGERVTYLLTPWRRVLLEKLTGSQPVKKFLAFYGARRFITAFTSARHLSISWASSIQSMPPYPTSWRSILTLSSHLRMGLPSGLFPSSIPTKTLYTPILSPYVLHAPLMSFFSILITWTILGEGKGESVNKRSVCGECVCLSVCVCVCVKYDTFVTVFNYTLRGKDAWGSGGVAAHILKLDMVWRWLVSLTSRPLYSRGQSLR